MGWNPFESIGSFFQSGAGWQGPASAVVAAPSAVASFIGGERANEANKDLARENMAWSERLSNTSYQRAMQDMEAAGLNPLLVGRLGGASTPGVNMPMMHDTITPAINTANQVAQTRSNVNLQREQENRTRIEAHQISEQIEKIAHEINLTRQQAATLHATAIKINEESKQLQTRTQGMTYDNALKAILVKYYRDNRMMYIAKDLGMDAGAAAGLISKALSRTKIVKSVTNNFRR